MYPPTRPTESYMKQGCLYTQTRPTESCLAILLSKVVCTHTPGKLIPMQQRHMFTYTRQTKFYEARLDADSNGRVQPRQSILGYEVIQAEVSCVRRSKIYTVLTMKSQWLCLFIIVFQIEK